MSSSYCTTSQNPLSLTMFVFGKVVKGDVGHPFDVVVTTITLTDVQTHCEKRTIGKKQKDSKRPFGKYLTLTNVIDSGYPSGLVIHGQWSSSNH